MASEYLTFIYGSFGKLCLLNEIFKRKAAGLPELKDVEIAKPENKVDQEQAKKAAQAAMADIMGNISIPGFDANKLKALMEGKTESSAPPGLKPGEKPKPANTGVRKFYQKTY